MPILNVLLRVLIVIVVVGLAVNFLPLLLGIIPTLLLWLLSGAVLFLVSLVFHQVGFDLIDWS